jgi:CubicO group peptidase (beta-lactamase class C family)
MRMRTVVVVIALVSVAACTGELPPPEPKIRTVTLPTLTPQPEPDIFPGQDWRRGTIKGADFARLDRTLAQSGSTCVSIVKDGRLVHDESWGGTEARTPRRVYSITKSLTSILLGMAADEGALGLDDTASEYVDEWRVGPAAEVSVRDLLSMTSGRHFDEATDSRMIRSAADKSMFSAQLPQDAAPGDQWVYDNSAVQTIESILDDVFEDGDVTAIAEDTLLGPLGMRDTTWPRDQAGNATTYSGVESTCQDLARVGLLMLREGRWGDRQLVSSAYVAEATRPSSDLNAAYGLLWWVNGKGRIVEVLRQAGYPTDKPPYEGQLAPDVPDDAFWAYGYGDQYVAVVPSEGIVAVRLGARPATPDDLTFEDFTRGVLQALGVE